jgi:predicted nuclease of predicted toxin-antitoxin system
VTRFLLDMGLAQSTAEFLKSLGHAAVHLRDEGLQRLPDDEIVTKAKNEQRVIITHDLDFGRIVALSGDSVPSVVTLRLTDMGPRVVNRALSAVLDDAAGALREGALVTVTDGGIRIRTLPVPTE